MTTRLIEELNLTVPSSLDIQEQQRVLIENFALLKDLVVSPGYIHFDRHKDTSDSLTTSYLVITNYSGSSDKQKLISVDTTTGLFDLEADGIYKFTIFVYIDGTGSPTYTFAILDSDGVTELDSESFDVHGGGGQASFLHSFILEFAEATSGLSLAIKADGSVTAAIEQVHCTIHRIDNYNIP